MHRAAAFATLLLTTSPVFGGPADIEILDRLVGSWQGKGELRDNANAEPGMIECRLETTKNGMTLTISGQCSGAAKGAKMAGNLRWSEGPGLYVGSLQGASLSGTRSLSGKRHGDSLQLRISGDDQASNLTMALSGNDRVRLTVTGGNKATLLDLPLTKR
ncbi:hypothetical protein [Breoghania sp. L-A4]|uniref:hypothetical protein n=1 Tax=Breoghania sp. L-A4 TaxID=2304600 RepID=UPI000E35A432|nr:hypothetical protein [Breoghania sp. L-A4]AXS41235.1 hypothetical protein D1F64_15885 [Breoghania sp. L-A4]